MKKPERCNIQAAERGQGLPFKGAMDRAYILVMEADGKKT